MTSAMSPGRRASFVVRVVDDKRGKLRGVIERVATGAKEAFSDLEGIGRVIAAMLRAERPAAQGPRRRRSPVRRRG